MPRSCIFYIHFYIDDQPLLNLTWIFQPRPCVTSQKNFELIPRVKCNNAYERKQCQTLCKNVRPTFGDEHGKETGKELRLQKQVRRSKEASDRRCTCNAAIIQRAKGAFWRPLYSPRSSAEFFRSWLRNLRARSKAANELAKKPRKKCALLMGPRVQLNAFLIQAHYGELEKLDLMINVHPRSRLFCPFFGSTFYSSWISHYWSSFPIFFTAWKFRFCEYIITSLHDSITFSRLRVGFEYFWTAYSAVHFFIFSEFENLIIFKLKKLFTRVKLLKCNPICLVYKK